MTRRMVCTYEYQSWPIVRPVFEKVRYQLDPPEHGRNKDFKYRWRHSDQHVWVYRKPRDVDDLLYRLPEVRRAVTAGQTIFWPEGEKDCEALVQAGVAATTHHQAAGNATLRQAAWLADASNVVLVADRDEPGYYDAAVRHDLLIRAGLSETKISFVRAAVGKDAADHLEAGLGVEDFVPVPVEGIQRVALRVRGATFRNAGYRAPGRLK